MENLRVYRRNSQKIVFLFDWDGTPYDLKISEISGGSNKEIKWEKIKIDQRKFNTLTEAIMVLHIKNDLNAFSSYRFLFEYNDKNKEVIKEIEIFPINNKDKAINDVFSTIKEVRIYGFDYEKNKWVPFPVDFIKTKFKK